MRIAVTGATLLLFLQACSTTKQSSESPFLQPNSLMAGEITRRVEQIPYQHRDELLQNLMWLAQTGEQTIPAVIDGLRNDSPKVRSSCAWVLGRIHDRRTIPNLQSAMKDSEAGVRLEAARSLVLMGDLAQSQILIEGLDSEKKEVRYMCHETLKTATGHDFGYDHLNQNDGEMKLSVLRWRQWWGEYSGDTYFAQGYQQRYNLQPAVAAPNGETRPNENGQAATPNQGQSNQAQPNQGQPNPNQSNSNPPNPNQGGTNESQVTPPQGAPQGNATDPLPMPTPAPTPNGGAGANGNPGTGSSTTPTNNNRPNGG